MRKPVGIAVIVSAALGLCGCGPREGTAGAPTLSMVVNPSLVSATAPNQPTAAEGGKFQEDLRFAGDYRERVAFQLVDEYMKDGMGAAEISLPIAYNAPFGSTNEVAVRYPVSPRHSIRNGAIFLDPNGPSPAP